MAKKFTTSCDFGGAKHPVTFFVGDAFVGVHPLAFQSRWLAKEKGGEVPDEIMDSFSKLKDIADQSKISFGELCDYVIDEVNEDKSLLNDHQRAVEFSKTDKKEDN